jgi:hypothetical protein
MQSASQPLDGVYNTAKDKCYQPGVLILLKNWSHQDEKRRALGRLCEEEWKALALEMRITTPPPRKTLSHHYGMLHLFNYNS